MSSLMDPRVTYFHADLASSVVDQQFLQALAANRQTLQTEFDRLKLHLPRDQMNYSQHEGLKSVSERYAQGVRIVKKLPQSQSLFKDINAMLDVAGYMLNACAFLKTIEMLGTEDQVKHWRSLCLTGRVIGCYGQTELGHGSNVQNLQTQAHYESATKTFRFNSPTASSSKYWPGLLGIYSTHAVLQAQTFINGKKIGVQTFVVPLRDNRLRTFQGVESGDMGSKLGMGRVDHGYLLFHNYHIPKDSMLMRYVRVDDDGKVHGLDNKQALKYGYGSMLNLRVYLASVFGVSIIKCSQKWKELQIARGTIGKPEIQHKLIRDLCMGYGIMLANKQTFKLFRQFSNFLNQKRYDEADQRLNECHIVSSTCKAVTAWKDNEVILSQLVSSPESTLKSSFIPQWLIDMIPSVTYEGDNSVLLQLTARHILKQEHREMEKPPQVVRSDNIKSMEKAAQYVYMQEVQRLRESLGKQMGSGRDMQQIWNEDMQREVIEVSKIWGNYTLIRYFAETLRNTPEEYQQFYNKIGLVFSVQVLKDIGRMSFYGLTLNEKDPVDQFTKEDREVLFAPYGFFNESDVYTLNSSYLDKKGQRLQRVAADRLSKFSTTARPKL